MAKRKGMKKRKGTTFKLNNKHACKVSTGQIPPEPSDDVPDNLPQTPNSYARVTREEYERVIHSPTVQGKVPNLCNTMFLRPLHKKIHGKLGEFERKFNADSQKDICREVEGYRLVHVGTISRVIQEATLAHLGATPHCPGILVALADLEIKRGAGVEEVFGCPVCGFKTDRKRLYRELPQNKRGRNPSELNVALQLALHNTCISTVGAQRFLSCLSSTSPSASSLQKSANNIGPTLAEENERDMSVKRKVVKDTLQLRGMPQDTAIHAEFDRQYNNPLRSSRKQTPFAPATQCRDVLVENATVDKFIIGYNHTNKLCALGNARRRKGEDVQCPGHEGCTATVGSAFNIGNEEDGGEKIARKLLDGEHPLKVSHLTTDADGKGCQGMNKVMKNVTGRDIENMLDEQHLNRSFCRAVSSTDFSSDMFPARTVFLKRLLQKRFAEDLSHRVQAEIRACRKALKNDHPKVVLAMRDCVSCILKCYSGDHTECGKKSFVCNKKNKYTFPFMPRTARESLQMLATDKVKLMDVIRTRTCERRLQVTRFGTSTQKAESMNRAFQTTNPKQGSTYSRNAPNRDHSAIHMVNNGPGESIAMKMAALGLEPSQSSVSTLRQLQQRRDYHRLRRKTYATRARKASLRKKKYRLYEKQGNYRENRGSCYKSDQLIAELADHTYHKECPDVTLVDNTAAPGTSESVRTK